MARAVTQEKPSPQTRASDPQVVPHLFPAPAPAARMRARHHGVLFAFLLLVLAPLVTLGGYLWLRAADQYASTTAFSVRSEEGTANLGLLGGLALLGGSTASDMDVLHDFLLSQDIVAAVDARLDLRAIYARDWPRDRLFAFDPSGTIEDLHRHWHRQVRVIHDRSAGLITLRVTAPTADQAQAIATAIHEEGSRMINDLARAARIGATLSTEEELTAAQDRVRAAREAMTLFRARSQIIDPQADFQGRIALIHMLESQLTEEMVTLDLLRGATRPDDPRIAQAERRAEVIARRIAVERGRFGGSDPAGTGDRPAPLAAGDPVMADPGMAGDGSPAAPDDGGAMDYAHLMAEYERLLVTQQFAEEAHLAALAAHDLAQAGARRQARFLAVHVRPTLAERALYPRRWVILGTAGLLLMAFWAMGVLVYYSIRDRR
ncbi:hypothetical protein [Halodurantibacterium flavum]|uniref:Sugar transporter n=1 Tax=Halodurantibacterium flavum TaxID=1382802 RepID=A0ABW4S4X4_9RHOB